MEKKCYKLETTAFGVNWDVAEDGCKNIGAHLASIESQCEQNTVVGLADGAAVWTGGNDKTDEGTFVWLNGNEFYKSGAAVSGAFTKLSTGFNSASTTTQHCVQLGATGEWDDVVCSKTLNYVCEKAAYAGAATLVITTVATTTATCSATCATGWTTIGCNCYKFQDVAKTWDDATTDCTALGTAEGKTGRLVSITSADLEVELLKMSSNEEFWTGGNDKASDKTFVWDLDGTTFFDDGTTTGYNNWWKTASVDQPNHVAGQDCVKFRVKFTSGTTDVEKIGWDDVSCDNNKKYICQYSTA